jgi:TetR/AcrR family transcriptional regulator, regulator of mycofactocin system
MPSARRGRSTEGRAEVRRDLVAAAVRLFTERGYDETTIDDIAVAAGVGRRTFFRYFRSKNDVPWGDFDGLLRRMRERLAGCPPERPLMEVVREALLDFNRVPPAELPWHRRRMELILRTPALQAHSTLRYADWRAALAGFVGERLGQPADALAPRTIAHATLGVALAAYEQWLLDETRDLPDLLDAAMRELADSFNHM